MAPEVLARFWRFVDKVSHPGGCWLWTGYVNIPGKPKGARGRNLYPRPRFRLSSGQRTETGQQLGQRHVYAHRLALALATGMSLEDAHGLDAHHTCENPGHRCINPYHQAWKDPATHRAEHEADRFGSFI